MAFAITPVAAKDGTQTTIPGGVDFIDTSGTGAGPWIITKVTIDPGGVNVQAVLSNNAAKTDLSSIAGTTAVGGHGTAAGALRVELPTDGTGQVNALQSGTWNSRTQDGSGTAITSTGAALDVNIKSGGGSGGTALADEAAFTEGATSFTPIGGYFKTTPTALTTGQGGALSLTNDRAAFTNLHKIAETAVAAGNGATTGGTLRVTLSNDSTGIVQANAGTNLNTSALALESGGNLATVAGAIVSQGTALGSIKELMVAGSVTTAAPTYTTGQISPVSLTTGGGVRIDLKDTVANTNNINVNLAASAATVTVSGTVTANAGTNLNTSSLALDTSVNGILVAQASTTSGEKGPLIQGAVTTNAPSYTTAQTDPLSLDTSGLLRCSIKDTPANTNNFNVALAASSATVTVTGTVTANQGGAPWTVNPGTAANWGVGATGSAVPANAMYKGGLAKTALPAAASDGNLTGAMVDKFGRQVTLVGTIRDLVGTQTTTISASTSETTIVTAGAAGIFNDLVMLIVSNTSAATNTRIDFRDTTAGSVLFSLQSMGGQQPVGFALPIPIPQTTAATNWTAQCATSTTDIRVYAVFAKNK